VLFSDWDVYQNCSPDAYYYLLFHNYLIYYLLFVTIFSLAIILPVNFQGTQGLEDLMNNIKIMKICFYRKQRTEIRSYNNSEFITGVNLFRMN
jgi:hypothetical protein